MAIGDLALCEVVCFISELPDDMQVMVVDLVCDSLGDDAYHRIKDHRFVVRHLPLRAFPRVTKWTDYRGREYAEAMIGAHLPPILVCGNYWLDGRHRVWAARRMRMQTITCIDLSEFGMTVGFPAIGRLHRK